MNRNYRNIIDYSERRLAKRKRQKFEKELEANSELRQGNMIFSQINEYMRGRFDLDEARKDPGLLNLDPVVEEMLSEYDKNPERYRDIQNFVRDSLGDDVTNKELVEETDQIKREINEHDINELSESWIKEWNEKNQGNKTSSNTSEKIRGYITGSLETENYKPEPKPVHFRKGRFTKTNIIRIAGLSAAAVIAAIFVINNLIPSNNIDRLYGAYYKPMVVFSPVTRSLNTNLSGLYAEAIEMYKKGDYQSAAAGFATIMQGDSSFIATRFFAGVTQMELGNYSQAAKLLTGVIGNSQEYRKEAQWYLGLACLKTGEYSKTIACFEALAGTDGFYRDQARKLLRRLK